MTRRLALTLLLALFAVPVGAAELDRAELLAPSSIASTSPLGSSWEFLPMNRWTRLPGGLLKFIAPSNATQVAITFAADVRCDSENSSFEVRALLDGEVADPSVVTLAKGRTIGPTGFTFSATVSKGVHVVEIEMDSAGSCHKVRNGTLTAELDTGEEDRTVLVRTWDPVGEQGAGPGTGWLPVTSMSAWVHTSGDDDLSVTFAGEARAESGAMEVRALVDGLPLGQPVELAGHDAPQARVWTFAREGGFRPTAGDHQVQMQYRQAEAGGRVWLGARTMVISAQERAPRSTVDEVVGLTGRVHTTQSTEWQRVPGLQTNVEVPPNADLQLRVMAEHADLAGAFSYMRVLVDGEVADPPWRTFDHDGVGGVSRDLGFGRVDFVKSDVNPGTETRVVHVEVQWKVWNHGNASIADRHLQVLGHVGTPTDPSKPFDFGWLRQLEAIPPMRVPVLLVPMAFMDDPDLEASSALFEEKLWGPGGAADYIDSITGGRVELYPLLDLPPMQPSLPQEAYTTLEAGEECEPGRLQRDAANWKVADVLDQIDDQHRASFSELERTGDNLLDARELVILAAGRTPEGGGWARHAFGVACNWGMRLHNYRVEVVGGWFARPGAMPRASTAAEEIAHLLLGINDLYSDHSAPPSPDFNHWTHPRHLSLTTSSMNHLDGAHKLWLGLVSPTFASMSGTYTLEDVKDSEEVLVLPRLDGDKGEYFVLENRVREPQGSPDFDTSMDAGGIAIWHVIDPSSPGASAKLDLAPRCIDQGDWDVVRESQRVLRLIKTVPNDIPLSRAPDNYYTWSSLAPNPVLQGDAFLALCPAGGHDGTSELLWADGTASPYNLTFLDPPGESMRVEVTTLDGPYTGPFINPFGGTTGLTWP